MAEDNTLLLYGSVGANFWGEDYFTPSQVAEWLRGRSGEVTVRINSGGGVAADGQAIHSLLSDYAGAVHVIVDGAAASAASLIAMAGDRITMRLGSWLLIHDPATPWTEGRGTEDEHMRVAAMLRVMAGAYAQVYARRAGLPVEEARRMMRDEVLLDGAMAVQMGLATDTDTEVPAAAAAVFDYRIYRNAPAELRARSESLGAMPGQAAVTAMFAGGAVRPSHNHPRKEPLMAVKDETAAGAAPAAGEGAAAPAAPVVTAAVQAATPAPVAQAAPQASAGDATIRERTRIRRITDLASLAGMDAGFIAHHVDHGSTVEAVTDAILAQRAEAPVQHHTPRPAAATVTADVRDRFREGATRAIMAKVGLGGERNEFTSLSLRELARASIEVTGERARFSDARDMVGHAFTMAGSHSTSDFANVLANVMGKAALRGWEEAEETYQLWTRPGVLTDFKATKRVGAGLFAALPSVPEGANYTYGTVGDRGEPITLATYGRLLRITRQAIINDDLSILGMLPRRMGRAARRTIGDLVYAILNTNPTMSDGVALFHTASHGNLAGSGAAITVDSLAAGKAAMRVQKDAGSALNITPKYLIVPAAKEMQAAQVLNSTVDPGSNKGHAINPVAGMAELVTDARLDDASPTAWYLAADQNAFDTIEVAYLDGNDAPYLEEQTAWSADGVELKVRIDAGVAPLDYRTMYKNPGA